MAKKTCGECGAPRGTPHAIGCSNRIARATKPLSMGGLVISRTPMTKAEADEGLRVSKATGRISLHTPMDRAPPGPCACGSGLLFGECHGAPPPELDFGDLDETRGPSIDVYPVDADGKKIEPGENTPTLTWDPDAQ